MAGASVNLKSYYWTPLAAASYRGHLRLVKELIKAGADVNIGLWYKTPIELARFAKHYDVVEILKKGEAGVRERYFYHMYQPQTYTPSNIHTREYAYKNIHSERAPRRN